MADPEQEGGLVDVFRRERSEVMALLAIPEALNDWNALDEDELKSRFLGPDVPEGFRKVVYKWFTHNVGNLQWFLWQRQQTVAELHATAEAEEEKVRQSRAHELALQGFVRSVRLLGGRDEQSCLANSRRAYGVENVVADTGGVYVAGGRAVDVPETDVTIYVRRQPPAADQPGA